jgi:hypothetical protein
MELYPPPDNGGYATPWLWVDGRSRGWEYQYWRGYVEQQMAAPADVGITIDGTFDPVARTGLARAVCTNGSGQSVTAACQMVLTEDSVYYPGTNGDYWHNHLCRDYLPDEHGTEVVLAPGGCDTVVQSFALEDTWDAAMCNIVVYLQNMTLQPDSSMPVFQGAIARLSGFTAVEEPEPPHAPSLTVSVSPNPAGRSAQVRFTFDLLGVRLLARRASHPCPVLIPIPTLYSPLSAVGPQERPRPDRVARGLSLPPALRRRSLCRQRRVDRLMHTSVLSREVS